MKQFLRMIAALSASLSVLLCAAALPTLTGCAYVESLAARGSGVNPELRMGIYNEFGLRIAANNTNVSAELNDAPATDDDDQVEAVATEDASAAPNAP